MGCGAAVWHCGMKYLQGVGRVATDQRPMLAVAFIMNRKYPSIVL